MVASSEMIGITIPGNMLQSIYGNKKEMNVKALAVASALALSGCIVADIEDDLRVVPNINAAFLITTPMPLPVISPIVDASYFDSGGGLAYFHFRCDWTLQSDQLRNTIRVVVYRGTAVWLTKVLAASVTYVFSAGARPGDTAGRCEITTISSSGLESPPVSVYYTAKKNNF
jgi:hypothetical protein